MCLELQGISNLNFMEIDLIMNFTSKLLKIKFKVLKITR
jgi:hypothetical protein